MGFGVVVEEAAFRDSFAAFLIMWNPFRKTFWVRRTRVEIDPEEVFMDSVNIPGFRQEMHEGRIERPIERRSFFVFAGLLFLGLGLIGWRLFDMNVLRGGEFMLRAEANKTYPIRIVSPRGIFYDRNFEKLVENEPTFGLSLSTADFSEDAAFAGALEKIASTAEKNLADIADANGLSGSLSASDFRIRREWPRTILIATGDIRPIVLEVQARPEQYPGVRVEEAGRRNYLLGENSSHLIGYLGRPSSEDLSKNFDLSPSDMIGKTGLELQYESFLQGSPGEKIIEVDAKGEPQRERYIVKARAGNNMVLEIDSGLQQFAAETLARHVSALGKKAGALVAIDPRDGAIRALASFPTFDPNIFNRGLTRSELERAFGSSKNPLFNRAISGGYPAGSTIKPLLATAALEEHIIDPERTIYDPGYISVPNPFDPANPTIFKDWKELGIVDMRRALAMSANVYFYTIGGGYNNIPGLGIARIKLWLERFGWGKPLGIDLAGENGGLIPDPEVKKTTRPNDPIWRIGDTYITSIGQGDLQITPLQLAAAISAIANNGTLWKPRLAHAVVDEERNVLEEFKPEVIRTSIADPVSFAVVREGMRQAVTEGSAIALNDLFFSVAGKTGTAQTGVYGKNHGWFTGFAPYDNPELVIVVLVEEGTGGSTDAVPIAKEVLYYYFTHKDSPQLTPLENSHTIDSISTQNQN